MASSSDIVVVQQFQSLVDTLQTLKDLLSSSTIDVVESRSTKGATQSALSNKHASVPNCKFIRDDNRIVISAPEIIIGDVDQYGNLSATSNGSKVTIRTNKVALEGVSNDGGNVGSVITRAPHIRNIAVDAGIDGSENYVMPTSSVVLQATGVDIISESNAEMFNEDGVSLSSTGINLSSDSHINVVSVVSNANQITALTAQNKVIDDQITELKSMESDSKSRLDSLLDRISTLASDSLHDSGFLDLYSSTLELDAINAELESTATAMYSEMDTYFKLVSQLIEKNRVKGVYADRIDTLNNAKSKFDTTANNTFVNVRSEAVAISSVDGDGNVRSVDEAAVSISAKSVSISSSDTDSSVLEGGSVDISANAISLITSDCTTSDGEAYEFPANGTLSMVSKSISMEAVDYQKEKDKEVAEKALTVGGTIKMRAETISSNGADTEGKSAGTFSVNAKIIEAKATDIKPDDGSEQNITAGSTFTLTSETVTVGKADDDKFKTKTVATYSDKVTAQADTSIIMKQTDGATLTIEKDKQTFDVKAISVTGTSEFADNSEFKKKVTAKEGSIDTLKVNSKFDSPKISNG
ncbi:MAG: hypothetical protein SNG35_00880 [Rikenellaceae bacterium]